MVFSLSWYIMLWIDKCDTFRVRKRFVTWIFNKVICFSPCTYFPARSSRFWWVVHILPFRRTYSVGRVWWVWGTIKGCCRWGRCGFRGSWRTVTGCSLSTSEQICQTVEGAFGRRHSYWHTEYTAGSKREKTFSTRKFTRNTHSPLPLVEGGLSCVPKHKDL